MHSVLFTLIQRWDRAGVNGFEDKREEGMGRETETTEEGVLEKVDETGLVRKEVE